MEQQGLTVTSVEYYRVRILGEYAAQFDNIEAACDAFSAMACEHCYSIPKTSRDLCCDIETWEREERIS